MASLFGIESGSFLIYDIILLILFALFFGFFLYKNRKGVKREGLLLLYRTKWGIKFINYVGKKYKKLLGFLSYVSITVGYLLMAGILYLVGRIVWIYVFHSEIVQAIKIPPIMPLVPYIDKLVPGFPPFYFSYFIIIIAIIAITHEVAHGIFMRRYDIKIKSTGFGFFPFFLPVFPAAFVEQDEESMKKKSNFKQMSVLSAGAFANVLTALFFLGILAIFFSLSFSPAGVTFDTYPYVTAGISGISMVNNIPVMNPSYEKILNLSIEDDFNEIQIKGEEFLITTESLVGQEGRENILLYYDAPAIRAGLENTILFVNNNPVTNIEQLSNEIDKYNPGDRITLTVIGEDGENYNKDIVLGENPQNESLPWLGIGFINQDNSGLLRKFVGLFSLKEPHIHYESKFNGGIFIYNLLWWLVIISLSVALVNMLPVGIFDGGRFFYLTILAITKDERKAKKAYSFSTRFFLFILLVVMFFWIFSFR